LHTQVKLIVGLGNPGAEYEDTRHNCGAQFVEAIASEHGVTLRSAPKLLGRDAKIVIQGHTIRLFIPETFMNLSGRAIHAIATFYKILPEAIVVVHDEIDLPPGTIRLKEGGGHGGHNGLRDTINHLHGPGFLRLRIGVGHPGHKDDVTDFVLKRPSRAEDKEINEAMQNALSIIPELASGHLQRAMHQLHTEE